jgi:hypothetical protein
MIQHKSRIDKTEYTFEKYPTGTMYWYKNGKLHRDNDKPAIIYSDETMEWWRNNLRHRGKNLPAVIWNDGDMEWWSNGDFIRKTY